jgi:predicted nucleotidyltransferase
VAIPRDLVRDNPGLGDWSIFTVYRGSIAHGTYTPSKSPNSIDDKDVMALCVPDYDHYIGLKQFGSRGTREIKRDEWDIVIYEIQKAISLLAQGNPNILQILWLEDRHYIKLTKAGRILLDNRSLFVGKHVYKPFVGYARAQFKKMTTGNVYQGYMGEKRKNLVKRYGFDTKNAAHMIRLLRGGVEFLATGEMLVERPDAAELIAIKQGAWDLERVNTEAERLFSKIEDALMHSKLPDRPDRYKVNRICCEIVTTAWFERGHARLVNRDGIGM